MSWLKPVRSVGRALSMGLLATGSYLATGPAHADVIILVDTAADVIANDGLCSLREAITAANNNGNYFGCIGNGGGYDLIEFSIGAGTPVINLATALPQITGPVEINGAPNRVELRGSGTGTGLYVSGAGTAGSIIRNLVISGFSTGIQLRTTTGITIGGTRIGTNAAGTAAAPNATGILLSQSSAQIGGTSGVTAGGPCTGDCNLVSGNSVRGIHLFGNSSATIQGNFIGTNASGTAPLGNGTGDGIRAEDSFVTVGGTSTGAGNLISGNANGSGIFLRWEVQDNSALGSDFRGNRIGTNAAGLAAIANGNGISVNLGNRAYPMTIGGAATGARNLISGNLGAGILVFTADDVIVHGNLIGTQANGTSPLPNGTSGVQLSSSTHGNFIGGTGAGEGNVIAHNATGVTIGQFNYHNRVRGNSIRSNAGEGISLADFQTNTAFAPSINGVSPVSGTACPGCPVDLYSDATDEGGTYHGAVVADVGGNWTFNGPVTGPNITATATSTVGSTSEFSAPFPYAPPPDTDGDGFADPADNCRLVANPSQLDADADGYGNLCDADLNNTGLTTTADFAILRSVLNQSAGSSANAAAADLNGSGTVTTADFAILRARLNSAPGPSGLTCAGTVPCP